MTPSPHDEALSGINAQQLFDEPTEKRSECEQTVVSLVRRLNLSGDREKEGADPLQRAASFGFLAVPPTHTGPYLHWSSCVGVACVLVGVVGRVAWR